MLEEFLFCGKQPSLPSPGAICFGACIEEQNLTAVKAVKWTVNTEKIAT